MSAISKSKKNRIQRDQERIKLGEIIKNTGHYRNEHRFMPRSYLAKNIPQENEDGEDSSSDKQSSVKSGSALRDEIRLKETLGYIKSALVPSSGPQTENFL